MSEKLSVGERAKKLRQEIERCGFALVPAQLVRDCDELIAIELAAAEERGRRAVFADPEALARRFHETYERLAPEHGYETRKESAVPWGEVPEKNRRLMVAVCAALAPRCTCPSGVWSGHVDGCALAPRDSGKGAS